MSFILKSVNESGAAFRGIGDIEQTQPVGRGAPMRAMLEQTGCVVMDEILRQKVDWQAKATLDM
jgi:ATP-dependent exoDNAse (exonuclease V) alpha subunit